MAKLNEIFPSSIVTAQHYDPFECKMVIHPFVVWKRQGFTDKRKNNVYAFRVTTQAKEVLDDCKVFITPSMANGLLKHSIVCTDSIFLLDGRKCNIIGQLNSDDFTRVIESRNKCQLVENQEAIHTLKNIIAYEKYKN